MTKDEFLKLMQEWGVMPHAYSINGEEKEDSLNIKKESDHNYSVYYLERGKTKRIEKVSSIEDAYNVIAQEIKEWLDLGINVNPVSKDFIENYDEITKQWLKEWKLKNK